MKAAISSAQVRATLSGLRRSNAEPQRGQAESCRLAWRHTKPQT
jgi:hypothetical protein